MTSEFPRKTPFQYPPASIDKPLSAKALVQRFKTIRDENRAAQASKQPTHFSSLRVNIIENAR
jgi:hypothetical protein